MPWKVTNFELFFPSEQVHLRREDAYPFALVG